MAIRNPHAMKNNTYTKRILKKQENQDGQRSLETDNEDTSKLEDSSDGSQLHATEVRYSAKQIV